MRIDSAGENVLPRRVDHLGFGMKPFKITPDRLDNFAVDQDFRAVRLRGRYNRTVLDNL